MRANTRTVTEQRNCHPCEKPAPPSACCQLDCLVQPRFFCGQLLTDADLTALRTWAEAKFRLGRYRHGWGVVCGLTVEPDDTRGTGIVVKAGYAVDCCGNDIVVCQDYSYDLADFCPPVECMDPYAKPKDQEDYRSGPDQRPTGTEKPASVSDLFASAKLIDVSLVYDTREIDPQPALQRESCGQATLCEPARTVESFQLIPRPVESAEDPLVQAAEERQAAYDARVNKALDFAGKTTSAIDEIQKEPWTLQKRVDSWLGALGPGQSRRVPGWFEIATHAKVPEKEALPRTVFELVQHDLRQWLDCGCPSCKQESGVPLARVWLLLPDPELDTPCRVLWVENTPPYRRPLAPFECSPVPVGCTYLGKALWQPPAIAEQMLRAAGVAMERGRRANVTTATSWISALSKHTLIYTCAPAVKAAVINVPPLGERVIGFTTYESKPEAG